MSEFNFDFGDGLVPAHHHPKGGGIVADSAMVDETVYVGPYAMIYGNARVYGDAKIDGYARVYEDAFVYENAKISGDARVYGKAAINGNARISGNARIYDKAKIMDQAQVFGEAEVYGNAIVRNSAEVYEDARVYGDAELKDFHKVYANCVCTKKPIVITGFVSDVTISDHHITIGCVVLPPSLWRNKGRTLIRAFGHSDDYARMWLGSIMSVLEYFECTDREEDLQHAKDTNLIRRILSGDTQDRIIARRKVNGTQN